MNPFITWFGGKWRAAPSYPSAEKFHTIVEPFAGSAGFSCRYPDKKIILAESDPHLYPLWKWLIHEATPQDILAIPVGVPEYTDIRTLELSHGQAIFLKSRQRTNNFGNCWTTSKDEYSLHKWTQVKRASVADSLATIKHWEIHKDGWELLENPIEGALYFIDPPYQYNYKYGCKNFDYARLGRAISALPNVIACEAPCPVTGALPTYAPFSYSHTITTNRQAKRPELTFVKMEVV